METNKVKVKYDGTLDKLNFTIVVRGDLQGTGMEHAWSHTVPFRSLKGSDAARKKCKIHQLDSFGAFLHANLVKNMYGMTYSGKYWYLDLKEWTI